MVRKSLEFVTPDWTMPDHIQAYTTTRKGGVSPPPYDSLNLAEHVNDTHENVEKNRQLLASALTLPASPLWLQQTHSTKVINSQDWYEGIEADAIYCNQNDHVCAIMTADCLPLLISNEAGTEIAAIHAGWRGLADSIIETTISRFQDSTDKLHVWLGPAIGPEKFEVGQDVFEAFINHSDTAQVAFQQTDNSHYLADIYQLARLRLRQLGITQMSGGDACTVTETSRFFSYRRDGETGRIVSLIWIGNK
ncbi:peptidoglycan editing factor PgeF [Methylophaga sp. UBA678]|uniref:peptidoglycan editing factor PgeF n=1 Tax=Methylophaga sp. UBA678 TaxID=1946901 RepID=UPI0023B6513F|nr:peptidoglycan editing factor PgeF [Methylophaga sp. UBA678]|tara:strand:- start:48373 stop:49122 length:750 start_codon:yes stop_codon:yes gene_type:complete